MINSVSAPAIMAVGMMLAENWTLSQEFYPVYYEKFLEQNVFLESADFF